MLQLLNKEYHRHASMLWTCRSLNRPESKEQELELLIYDTCPVFSARFEVMDEEVGWYRRPVVFKWKKEGLCISFRPMEKDALATRSIMYQASTQPVVN